MSDLKKILIRNIHPRIIAVLEILAGKNDRSVEAEARQALGAWVQPEISTEEKDNRLIELSRRLNNLLEQANSARKATPLKPSHVAEVIGEASAGQTERWFQGKEEPKFTQLTAIAAELGAARSWLVHGDGSMYPTSYIRLPSGVNESVKWLLTWEPDDKEATEQAAEIHLLREDSKEGRLLIVKISNKSHPKIFQTTIHISQETGDGGRRDLAHFAATLALLYKHYTKLGSKIKVSSCIVKTADFVVIGNGNTHPAKLIEKANGVLWWEDIWDKGMYPKGDYWPGWLALCESIEQTTSENRNLSEIRNQIKTSHSTDLE